MIYNPDCLSSDEDGGLSDDNDYYDFKNRLKEQFVTQHNNSTVDQEKIKLQSLFSAVNCGKNDQVISELENGLDININLAQDWTPLLLAIAVSNKELVIELLNRGADINLSRDGSTPLMMACTVTVDDKTSKANIEIIKALLEKGSAVNQVDRKRRTVLMLAAYSGHLDAVKLLLPLSNKDALDNQKWTALFWSVEGNNAAIVQFLMDEGFELDRVDIRGNTVEDIACARGFENVIQLFPQDALNNELCFYLNNQIGFHEHFEHLQANEKPQFFGDVCKILYGVRSESAMSIFKDQRIDLLSFLYLNDTKLENLGLKLPYQRNRIMGGIFRFHKHPYHPKSIPFIPRNGLYSNIDVSSTVLSCLKQIIAMEAGLKFILENTDIRGSKSKELSSMILKNRRLISRLRNVTQQFATRAEYWDNSILPADLIRRKPRNIPWSSLYYSAVIVSLTLCIYKYYK